MINFPKLERGGVFQSKAKQTEKLGRTATVYIYLFQALEVGHPEEGLKRTIQNTSLSRLKRSSQQMTKGIDGPSILKSKRLKTKERKENLAKSRIQTVYIFSHSNSNHLYFSISHSLTLSTSGFQENQKLHYHCSAYH